MPLKILESPAVKFAPLGQEQDGGPLNRPQVTSRDPTDLRVTHEVLQGDPYVMQHYRMHLSQHIEPQPARLVLTQVTTRDAYRVQK